VIGNSFHLSKLETKMFMLQTKPYWNKFTFCNGCKISWYWPCSFL